MSLRDDAVHVAAALCRRFEGFRAGPYLCPAGVPTIGYGSTRYPDGRPVRLTDPAITQDTANLMLLNDLTSERAQPVLDMFPGETNPGRLGALMDFAYNLGAEALSGSTLRRKAAAGDWEGAKVEIRRWVYAGGRRLPGLVARREAEAALL